MFWFFLFLLTFQSESSIDFALSGCIMFGLFSSSKNRNQGENSLCMVAWNDIRRAGVAFFLSDIVHVVFTSTEFCEKETLSRFLANNVCETLFTNDQSARTVLSHSASARIDFSRTASARN